MHCPFCSAAIPDGSELCPHCMSDLRNASPRGDRGTVTDSGTNQPQGYVPPKQGYVPPTQPGGNEPPPAAYVQPPAVPGPAPMAPPAGYAPAPQPQAAPPPPQPAPVYAPPAPVLHASPPVVSPADRQQMQARFTARRDQPAIVPPQGRRRTALDSDAGPAQPVQAEAVRGRTRLDRGNEAQGPGAGAAAGRRVVGWMISFDVNEDGQEYVIREGRNTLGRARDCDISVFYDEHVSSVHATIVYRNGAFKLRDEMTNNGTFLNGQDIGPGESAALQSGDVLRVGQCTFKLFLIDPGEAATLWPHLGATPS